MKILFVTPINPYECYSGGGVRTRLLWEALKKKGDVYTTVVNCWGDRLCSARPNDEDNIRCIQSFNAFLPRWKGSRFIVAALFSRWFDHFFMSAVEVKHRLGWEDIHFDVVVVRFLWMVPYVAAWKIAPVVVDIDDLPIEDYETLAKPELSLIRRWKCAYEVYKWQRLLLMKAKGAWLPNKFKLSVVEPFCRCIYLPNIVNMPSATYNYNCAQRDILITVGSLDYGVNRDGIDWFLTEVWINFHTRFPDFEYWIAGHKLPDNYRKRWEQIPGVRVLGFVKDLECLYASCKAVIAPVFAGGGTAVKVIEAIAHGRKIFATPFSVRGLSDNDKKSASIAEFSSAAEFIELFTSWIKLSDKEKKEEITRMRDTVLRNYSIDFFNMQVSLLLQEVLPFNK